MDCRRTVGLFVAFLLTACGCATSLPTLSFSGTRIDPDAEVTHKAPTYVAFGDFRARTAEAPENTPDGKRLLREEAKLAYLKALEVDPKHLPAYVALARVQMAAEDHPSASQTYGKALAMSPTDSVLYFEHGICQCRMKDWHSALASMRKALELDPSNRQYATAMGLALARAGQWDDAFAILERVNGQAKAHYDLARMLKHVGNQPDNARLHAAAAVAADPRFTDARTLLAELEKGGARPPVIQQTGYVPQRPAPMTQPPPFVRPAPPPPAQTSTAPRITQTASAVPQPIAHQNLEQEAPEQGPPQEAEKPMQSPPRKLPESVDRPIRVPPLPVIRLGARTEVAGNK